MPDPISRQNELIDKLSEYLYSETVVIAPLITWDDYYLDIASTDPPKGVVYIPGWTPNCQQNLDFSSVDYDLVIRLLIASPDFNQVLRSANAWGGYLTQTVLKKLRKDGVDGLFKGIDIRRSTIQEPLLNQDGGGKTSVIIPCVWRDVGNVSGLQSFL